MRKSLLLLPALILLGCDNVLDCAVGNRRADMQNKPDQFALRNDYVTIGYEAEIINDTADDEDYEYTFEITGDTPDGLDVSFEGRHVVLRGHAQKIGRWDFSIRVFADYVGPDGKCLAKNSHSNSYTIKVQ